MIKWSYAIRYFFWPGCTLKHFWDVNCHDKLSLRNFRSNFSLSQVIYISVFFPTQWSYPFLTLTTSFDYHIITVTSIMRLVTLWNPRKYFFLCPPLIFPPLGHNILAPSTNKWNFASLFSGSSLLDTLHYLSLSLAHFISRIPEFGGRKEG